jgi:hypothetical protein
LLTIKKEKNRPKTITLEKINCSLIDVTYAYATVKIMHDICDKFMSLGFSNGT